MTAMSERHMSGPSPAGDLTLGHVLDAAGIAPSDVVVVRHTYKAGHDDELRGPEDLAPERLRDYTHRQGLRNKLGKTPPPIWLVFIATGGLRCRLVTVYDNRGELTDRRTDSLRYFDLQESALLSSLRNRLVVEWSKDTINWAKPGTSATAFPVVEIADPEAVPFPGFDGVEIGYAELQTMVKDSRYTAWQTALGSVQGIYLIADTSTGHLYVGKADGSERILGRWSQYAQDGHGGNKALRELAGSDAEHRRHFQFSLLRVFGPSTPSAEVDAAEAHWKRALLTRDFGLNRN